MLGPRGGSVDADAYWQPRGVDGLRGRGLRFGNALLAMLVWSWIVGLPGGLEFLIQALMMRIFLVAFEDIIDVGKYRI